MITLRTLGAVSVASPDGDLGGLLRQPKVVGLLMRLASPTVGAWHRRDTLVGIFWPELPEAKARAALRSALYKLRSELGTTVVRARGDDELSLDPDLVRSDTAQMQECLDAGDLAGALDLYHGAFLPGFFITGAPEFDRWCEGERGRLGRLAAKAATQLSDALEAKGDLAGATGVVRRLVELDPDDEASTRRLIVLLDRAGDHGQALATFERLQKHLREAFDADPSQETLRIAQGIKVRRAPDATPVHRAHAHDVKAPLVESIAPDVVASSAKAPLAVTPSRGARWTWRRIGVAVGIAVFAILAWASARRPAEAVGPKTLLVLPMRNVTGDSTNDYIATGLAEDVAARLAALPSLTIRSAARSDWPARVQDSVVRIGHAFGAEVVLRTSLRAVGDSLQVDAEVVDPATGFARPAGTRRFLASDLVDIGSRLAASVAGALFRVPIPDTPTPAHPINPEAYRLTLLGWHTLITVGDAESARPFFLQATRDDPTYARAWSGLSSTWAAATTNGRVPFEDGFDRTMAAASKAIALDSMQGSAWANLGVVTALKERSAAAGEPYFDRAVAAEPANPEIYLIHAAVLRYGWQYDRARDFNRIADQLEPLSAYLTSGEATASLCEGNADEALRMFSKALELDPPTQGSSLGKAAALERLGRWDDAIAELRILTLSRGDTAVARALPGAEGESGYWALKHLEGKALLDKRLRLSKRGYIAPYLLGVAEIGAGDIDRGLDLLESEVKAGSRMVYKLPCPPELDEVRGTPRFQRLLASAGALPP